MRKAKAMTLVLGCIVLVCVAGRLLLGNPVIFINNHNLGKALRAIDVKTVCLNDIVPFDWDRLYTFEPYQSKAEIEKIVGFKSADITGNNINEGMVHLLFVKEDRVVASILGYADNLGYSIDFSSQISFAENARFDVTAENGIIRLISAAT